MKAIIKSLLFILAILSISVMGQNSKQQGIYLWPGKVPGEKAAKHEPRVMPDEHDNIARITDVTNPVLEVFDACRNCNGSAVIVCPGGGYNILAIGHEGYEIAT